MSPLASAFLLVQPLKAAAWTAAEGGGALTAPVLSFVTTGPVPLPTLSPAGALPIVFSLLGDLYDTSSRAGVSSIVQLSTGIGLAVGQGIAGFVGEARCAPCRQGAQTAMRSWLVLGGEACQSRHYIRAGCLQGWQRQLAARASCVPTCSPQAPPWAGAGPL